MGGGQDVAIKVQHECLQYNFPADLWTLRQAVSLLNWSFPNAVCLHASQELELPSTVPSSLTCHEPTLFLVVC